MSIVSFFLELPEKILQRQIVFSRMTNDNDNSFFNNGAQPSNNSQDFQDAEIVEDDKN
jgi:hypothetical protein